MPGIKATATGPGVVAVSEAILLLSLLCAGGRVVEIVARRGTVFSNYRYDGIYSSNRH